MPIRALPLPLTGVATRLSRTVAVTLAALALVTCGEPTSPVRPGVGTVQVLPRFDGFARLIPLVLDNVRVIVVRPPSTTLADVRRQFSVANTQLQLNIPVVLAASREDLDVTLELYAGTTLLFRGTSTVGVAAGPTPTPGAVPVVYQGPGSQLASITIGPRDTSVNLGATVPFGATAIDSQQAPVAQFYVSWSATNGTIDAAGLLTAPTARDTFFVKATTPTGITDSTRVFVVAPPSVLLKVGGDNQTGSIGTRLPALLAVQVNGTDGQPVPGVTVAFAAATGGGSVDSATATTDAAGVARTGAVLGATGGAQAFTAAVTGLAAATFTATATVPSSLTWNGSVSTDWFTAANWTPAAVPNAVIGATIPSAPANQPALNAAGNARTLTVQAGASVTLTGNTAPLTVDGDLLVDGTLVSTGTSPLTLSGTGNLRGSVGVPTTITGTFTLTGATNFGAGTLTVVGPSAALTVGGQSLVAINLSLGTGGALVMTNPADLVTVNGNFTAGGADHTGRLTAGTLTVAGSFTQTSGSSPQSFVATGTHVTQLVGSPSVASFQSPGATASRFAQLTVAAGTTTLASRAVAGAVLNQAQLTLAGRTLEVTGAFGNIGANALLVMTNPADSLLVAGNASFNGGNELGQMSAGVLVVGGNLTQTATTSGDAFHPSGSHKTVLTSPGPVLSFATPGDVPGTSHFQDLTWVGGSTLQLNSDVYAHGTLAIQSAGPSTVGGGDRLLFAGALAATGPLTFNATRLEVFAPTGGPLALHDLAFTGTNPAGTALTITHNGAGGPFTLPNLTFAVTPTSGLYLRADDPDGATNGVLTLDLANPSPATPGGFAVAQGGAVINWPAAAPGVVTWNGSVSNAWTDPANWSPARVPALADSVRIPNGLATYPTITSRVAVRTIGLDGRIFINGATLAVTEDITGSIFGRLVQTTLATDSVIVGDSVDANIAGGSASGIPGNGGVLVVGGNIGSSMGWVFLTTVLNGPGNQIWANQGTGGQGGVLLVRKPAGTVSFPGGFRADSVDVNTAIPITVAGGLRHERGFNTVGDLTVAGTHDAVGNLVVGGTYTPSTTTFTLGSYAATLQIPATTYQALTIGASGGNGNAVFTGRTVVTGLLNVGGTADGTVALNGNTITAGSFQTSGIGPFRLAMTNPLDSLIVAGNATFNASGINNPGNLTAGTALFGGNFTITTGFGGVKWQSTGTHKTVFTGPNPVITLGFGSGPATNQDRFNDLTFAGSGSFFLAGATYASGTFATTSTGTVNVTGQAAGSQPFTFRTRAAAGTLTVFDNLRVVVTQAGTGTGVGLDNTIFQNTDPTVTQLTLQHPGVTGGSVDLAGLTFGTVPTTGLYLAASDNNPGDGIPLVVNLFAPTPATSGGFTSATNATINWPGVVPGKTWTGAVNTDWNTAGNWTPAGVPVATDLITIPATANPPLLAQNVIVKQLTVQAGAAVGLNSFTIFMDGSLSLPATPGFTGTGAVALTGATGTVQGNLGAGTPVLVQGAFTLAGRTVTGPMTINGSGRLTIAGQTLAAAALNVANSALVMTNPQDSVLVTQLATFGGGVANVSLTAGVLALSGDLTQTGATTTFDASGTHQTAFVGPALQRVTLFFGRFGDLDVSGALGGVRLETSATVGGTFRSVPSGAPPVIRSASQILSVEGTTQVTALALDSTQVQLFRASTGSYQFDNVTWSNLAATATALTVIHPGDPTPLTFTNLSFTGPAPSLYLRATDFDGGPPNTLVIDLVNPSPASDGGLSQAVNGAVINWPAVSPAKTWSGAVSADWFTAGNWVGGVVPAAADSAVIPAGVPNSPVLTAPATVSGLRLSGNFAAMTLSAGLTVTGGVSLPDTSQAVTVSAGGTLTAGSLTIAGRQAKLDAPASSITVLGTTDISGDQAFVSALGSSNSFGPTIVSGFNAFLDHGGGNNGPITINGAGFWEALGPVTVTGSPAITINGIGSVSATGAGPAPITVVGDVTVGGTDGRLIASGSANGPISINGNLTLSAAGRLVMNTATDNVTVTGNATFGGGDGGGDLTAGVLTIGGDFSQLSATSGRSFSATGTHLTVFTGVSPTLTFNTPGFGAGLSHFNNVAFAGTTVNLASGMKILGALQTTAATPVSFIGDIATTRFLEFATISAASALTFDQVRVRVSQTGTGTPVGLANATWINTPANIIQLNLDHPGLSGGSVVLSDLTFTVTPTTGVYLNANDTNTGDGIPLVVDLANPTPATDGGFSAAQNGAVINWPAGTPILTWTGAADNNWDNPANWSGGAVPTSADDVLVPAGTPNDPVSGTIFTRDLTVAAGATLTAGDHTYFIDGDLDAQGLLGGPGACCDIQLRGNGVTARGNIQNFSVSVVAGAVVSLNGTLTLTGNANLSIAGELIVNGHTLDVGLNQLITTANTGLLTMTNPADQVVAGATFFQGGDQTGRLTAGTLRTQSFFQGGGTVASSFFAGGSHRVVLAAAGSSQVSFADPGSSRFQDLDVAGVAATLTLQSDVTVAGQLQSVTGGVNGPVVTTGGGFQTLTAGGVDVNAATGFTAATFANVRLVISGGTIIGLNDAVFTAQDPTVTQLTVNNVGQAAPFIFDNLDFQTVPTSGLYVAVSDLDGPSPDPFQLSLTGAQPATPGAFTSVANGAVLTWNGASPSVSTWTGALSTDWTTAANWSTLSTPDNTTDVVIPAGTPNAPVVILGALTRDLTIQPGAILDLGSSSLIVAGNLDNGGSIVGTPSAAGLGLIGTGKLVRGALTDVTVSVSGSYTLNGRLLVGGASSGDLAIPDGALTLNGQTLEVTGTFVTSGVGVPIMQNALDSIIVARDAIFAGGNTTAAITAGVLRIGGNLSQAGGDPAAYSPQGTHKLLMEGNQANAPTEVLFANPASSHLATAEFANPFGVSLGSRVMATVSGTVTVLVSAGEFTTAGSTLEVGGHFTTTGTGTLRMPVSTDSVIVGGDATFAGASTDGSLTEGVLVVGGDFIQAALTSTTSFAPSQNHKTVLGSQFATRTVNLGSPGSGPTGSHFQHLDLSPAVSGVTLIVNTPVDGTLSAANLGGGVPVLIGGGATLTVGGFAVTALAVDNAPLVLSAGSAVPLVLDNVTFSNMDPTVTQLAVTHPGQATTIGFTNLTFNTVPSSGLYVALTDADGASPDALTVSLINPTPGTDGGFSSVANGAVLNWPGTAPAVSWTGATSSDWSTAANWSTNQVPTATNDVTIPTGLGTYPVLTAASVTRDLTVQTGGSIDLNGFTLTSSGSVDAGTTISGAGTFIVSGAGVNLRGTVPSLRVTGNVTLAGPTTVTGSLTLDGIGGNLSIGDQVATVAGDLVVQNAAALTMTSVNDALTVAGNATFDGGTTVGFLTAGVLRVAGNFTQLATSSTTAFAPTGTSVILDGAANQVVSLASPGAALSRFSGLTIAKTGGLVDITANGFDVTDSLVLGSATTLQGTGNLRVTRKVITAAGSSLAPGVLFVNADSLQVGGTYAVGNTQITGGTNVPALSYAIFVALAGNLTFAAPATVSGNFRVLSGSQVTLAAGGSVGGNVAVSAAGSRLIIGPGTLTVAGSGITVSASGLLVMQDPGGVLDVAQASFSGGDETGFLTAGELRLRGSVSANVPTAYNPSGTHRTSFLNTANAIITGFGGFTFNDLDVSGAASTLQLLVPTTVNGTLTSNPTTNTPTFVGTGSESLTVLGGVQVGTAVFDNVPLILNGSAGLVLDNATFQNFTPTLTQLTVNHPGPGSPFLFNNPVFSTTPTTGFHLSATDTNVGDGQDLFIEMVNPTPAGSTFIQLGGTASVLWP